MEGVDEVDTENLSGVVQPMATIYDAEAIEALRKQAAVQPQTLKQFRNRLFKQAAGLEEAMAVLPVEPLTRKEDNAEGNRMQEGQIPNYQTKTHSDHLTN